MNLQAADQENEQRRRLEAAAAEALNTSEEIIKRNKLNQKKQQVCRTSLMLYCYVYKRRLELANEINAREVFIFLNLYSMLYLKYEFKNIFFYFNVCISCMFRAFFFIYNCKIFRYNTIFIYNYIIIKITYCSYLLT